MGSHPCGNGCPSSFQRKSTLTTHRKKCAVWLGLQSAASSRHSAAAVPSSSTNLGVARSWRDIEERTWAADESPLSKRRKIAADKELAPEQAPAVPDPAVNHAPSAEPLPSAMDSYSPSLSTLDLAPPMDISLDAGAHSSTSGSGEQAQPEPQVPTIRIPPIRIRIPQYIRDMLPEPVPTLPPPIRRVILNVRDELKTAKNAIDETGGDDDEEEIHILPNPTWAALMEWKLTGSQMKSDAEVDRLAKILQQDDFKTKELKGFSSQKAARLIDKGDEKSPLLNHFKEVPVPIEVPSGDARVPSKTFEVPGLHYRPLLSLLKAAFANPLAAQYHFSPFKLFHTSPLDQKTRRVHSEVYDSDAFIQEHEALQKSKVTPPDDPNCKREKVIAAMMFWSDSTHLANFGTAKLWPIYMFLGNLTKYVRALPNSGACQHVAYIPSLSDAFQDELGKWHAHFSLKPSHRKDLLTHCRRELMHGVWRILFDDDFVHAYKYGIVIKCLDGIERRVFPRVFSYSADYPEKVLLATIRDKGLCLCPRCLVSKDKVEFMGRVRDLQLRVSHAREYLWDKVKKARDYIYKKGRGIKSTFVEAQLKETSSVPTVNAFVERLGRDFPLSRMMVPDFLHEFELGVWKSLFTHLVRILYAAKPDGSLVLELDRRFRQIPTFGTDTIRRFAENTSEMKKLAARDFEDILQCCIPAFDGLLPNNLDENGRVIPGKEDENRMLLKLLYRTAELHAFAKLRIHTDGIGEANGTLDHLEEVTSEFGKLIRQFRDKMAEKYNTVELPSEAARRARQATRQDAGGATRAPPPEQVSTRTRRKQKALNLATYKFHSIGDYAAFIRLFGGTDSISTQVGELAHRLVKRLYTMTNKQSVAMQIGRRVRRIERARLARERRLQQEKLKYVVHRKARRPRRRAAGLEEDEDALREMRDFHCTISHREDRPLDLFNLVKEHRDDPAYKNFIPKLKAHLLARRLNRPFDGDAHDDFSDEDRNTIRFYNNRIYQVATCQVNYTTYDNRRDYDTINSTSHPDVMVLSQEDNRDAKPFWYARVLGVYHAKVSTTHPRAARQNTERMYFLFVRWLGAEPSYSFGFRRARLPKVGFVQHVEEYDNFAFGFLDPEQILRGVHLIPDFNGSRTTELLPYKSPVARQVDQSGEDDDWANYYVNVFADRDMVMRHYGGGVGHHEQIQRQYEMETEGLSDDEEEEEPEPAATVPSSTATVAEALDGDEGSDIEDEEGYPEDDDDDVSVASGNVTDAGGSESETDDDDGDNIGNGYASDY
ncbi:hypothetical protein NMY22_g1435 [Coprinellus aureogranulatus]|nr:hypothetical protein NMY22_g1435 [Coprinellus aureogranulatus]